MKDRILRAAAKAKRIEAMKFTEKELRGLTKSEKVFVRENNYSVCLNQNGIKLYMFVAKQLNGRKSLYAITKKQSINPNGHDISNEAYNYECWLLFDKKRNGFSKFYYERRFCKVGKSEIIIHA